MKKIWILLLALVLLLCACESEEKSKTGRPRVTLAEVEQDGTIEAPKDSDDKPDFEEESEEKPEEEPSEEMSEEPEESDPTPIDLPGEMVELWKNFLKDVVPQKPVDDGVTYFDCGPLRVPIPNKYIPLLTIEQGGVSDGPLQPLLRVYEKASLDAAMAEGYRAGFLFEIDAVNPSRHDEFLEMRLPGSRFFARDSNYLYVYTKPTDFQYFRPGMDESGMEQWNTLCALGEQVLDALLSGGALKAYSATLPEPEPDPVPPYTGVNPAPPTVTTIECKGCHGTGFCTNCTSGRCNTCHGRGQLLCTRCTGLGHCGYCGGCGYQYKGVGLMHRKEDCHRCNGTGDCSRCNNRGYLICGTCGGDGNCGICDGLGICPFCNGTGQIK